MKKEERAGKRGGERQAGEKEGERERRKAVGKIYLPAERSPGTVPGKSGQTLVIPQESSSLVADSSRKKSARSGKGEAATVGG